MSTKLQGFFGYSSTPASSGDAIEKAVKALNDEGTVAITTWRTLARGGNLVINEILNFIEKSDFTCFDLTGMNENVLYEIGFALAKRKTVWLVFDTSYDESRAKWEQLMLLSDITYVQYSNSEDIVKKFNIDKPYASPEIFTKILENSSDRFTASNVLLHLKQQVNTDASRVIDSEIEIRKLPVTIDDPYESKVQNLTWYINNIYNSVSIVAELSSQYRSGSALQNMKCSFVCGVARGLEKKVIMLAEDSYRSPSDYKNLVKIYNSSENCKRLIAPFLNDTKTEAVRLYVAPKPKVEFSRAKNDLQTLSFGEWIAEHEKNKIADYYVETKHISSLLKNEHNIIVGRKGCGKTASFYYLEEVFSNDVRNIVCLIKPNSFEIDSLLALLQLAQEDYQKHYLIEASWKFLIYTEIARNFYEKISSKASYALTNQEREFISYVESNSRIILSDFSSRLELKLTDLKEEFGTLISGSQEKFTSKISEHLHNTVLYDIRGFIADLAPKDGRVVVLIDNLDKSWKVNKDLVLLSQWVLGLLSVSGRLANEISYIKKKNTSVEFSLTIFLRTDILKHVIRIAREPDKIEKTELKYDDKEILFRILNERFKILNEGAVSDDELWTKFITPAVNNIEVKDFIFSKIYPRPRDLLVFIRHAKDTAVARGHETIEASDLVKAHDLYSDWVLSSLFVENGITQEQMEEFLYSLLGSAQIVSQDEVITAMQLADIDTSAPEKTDYFIDHLVALSILGREVSDNHFSFEYDLNVDRRNKILASKLDTKRFRIHSALCPALHLKVQEN